MRKTAISLLFCVPSMLASQTGLAHHAYASDFAENLYGSIRGEVVEVFWYNPHVQWIIEVPDDEGGGTSEWAAISMNLAMMDRIGWQEDTLQLGDRVEIYGRLGRDSRPLIWIQTVTWDEGETKDMGVAGPLR